MPALPDARYEYYTTGAAKLRFAAFEPAGAPRGTFLVSQGRREFIEKKILEIGRDLVARGYKIIFYEMRSQGLSTRLLDGERHQYDHLSEFDTYISDLRAFYRDVVKPRQSGPFFVFAHSMGALTATRWLAETPEDRANVKALIMTSPALVVNVPPLALPISKLMVKLGRGECYAGGQHDYGAGDRRFERNLLSHDPERFTVMEKYFTANPELKVGGVTWGWLATALQAMKRLQEPGYLGRLAMPVLALFGTRDFVTPPAKIIPLIRQMPNAEIATIRGAWHDLMNEADQYRDQAWRHIDAFLNEIIRG